VQSNKRDSYKRRVAKLEKQLVEHSRQRVHYANIVAGHLGTIRRHEQTLLDNAGEMVELKQQLAVCWKNWSEAKDDAATAKLNQQALGKELNHIRAERMQLRTQLAHADTSYAQLGGMIDIQRQEMEAIFARTPAGWWRRFKVLIGRA